MGPIASAIVIQVSTENVNALCSIMHKRYFHFVSYLMSYSDLNEISNRLLCIIKIKVLHRM